MKRQRTRRRLNSLTNIAPELLERRALLAGNIEFSFDPDTGIMEITGDDEDNRFQIDRGTLMPATGTTVNGVFEDIEFGAEVSDIRIDMGGGSDYVLLQLNPFANDVTFIGGPGDDGFIVWGSEIGGDLRVRTGGGDDIISIGRANGNFDSMGDIAGNVYVTTGGGADIVSIGGSRREFGQSGLEIGKDLTVRTGAGDDEVGVARSTIGDDMFVRTGDGTDEVHSLGNTVADRMDAKLGDGDDWAYVRNTNVEGKARVHGGDGVDHVLERHGDYAKARLRSLEGTARMVDIDAFEKFIFDTFWHVWQ